MYIDLYDLGRFRNRTLSHKLDLISCLTLDLLGKRWNKPWTCAYDCNQLGARTAALHLRRLPVNSEKCLCVFVKMDSC